MFTSIHRNHLRRMDDNKMLLQTLEYLSSNRAFHETELLRNCVLMQKKKVTLFCKSLPRWHRKSNAIVQKILKILTFFSGVVIRIAEIIDAKYGNLHCLSLSLKTLPVGIQALLLGVLWKNQSCWGQSVIMKFTVSKTIFIIFKIWRQLLG